MRYQLSYMKRAAENVQGLLAAHCEPGYCEIAGSIRRKKKLVGDVEIVCIPKKVMDMDLFGHVEEQRDQGFIDQVNIFSKVKGKPTGKYTQRIVYGVKVDIFMVNHDSWGTQLAIRTGPAEYSHKVLARRWCSMGYKMEGGVLHRNGEAVPVKNERSLFNLLGLRWVEPENRRA